MERASRSPIPFLRSGNLRWKLGRGESICFRLRVRLDAAGLNHEAQLHLDSDAVNGAADSTGCTNEVLNCSHHRDLALKRILEQ